WRARPTGFAVLRGALRSSAVPPVRVHMMRPPRSPRGVAILGSTGSIGRSTLDVLRRQQEHFRVVALTCGRNREEFAAQVAEWQPAFAGLALSGGPGDPWPCGPEVLIEAATLPEADIVV